MIIRLGISFAAASVGLILIRISSRTHDKYDARYYRTTGMFLLSLGTSLFIGGLFF